MSTLLGFLSFLFRLVRPSQASHASPYGRVAGVLEELRRIRSGRARRFVYALPSAREVPALPSPRPAEIARALEPRAVLARVPADYVPIVDPREVEAPAAMVRAPYVAWERRQEQRRIDRQRLGVAVLLDVATRAEVSA